MSSANTNSPTNSRRPSRFIEGEPLTHSPSSTTNPFFTSILSEQDQIESLRGSDPRSRQGSNSSGSSSHSQPPKPIESSPPKKPIKSTRPAVDWTTAAAAVAGGGTSSSPREKDRSSLEEGRPKESTSEKLVGRIRAFTAGHSGLERKIQKGEVVLYPGT